MARIRSIKPDFWTDEKVVELSAFARLLFIGLWNFADDEGRMAYSPKKIKMQIFPADTLDISELFGEIRGENLVEIYSVDNTEYLQITHFSKHQKIDKRTPSKLPPNPDSPPESPRIPTTEGKGREEDKEEESKYRFAGVIVKLKDSDYSQLKRTYSGIPDFDAELDAADKQYQQEKPGNWFIALGNRLNARHQGLLSRQPQNKPRKTMQGMKTM